jgi:hypothetical protein
LQRGCDGSVDLGEVNCYWLIGAFGLLFFVVGEEQVGIHLWRNFEAKKIFPFGDVGLEVRFPCLTATTVLYKLLGHLTDQRTLYNFRLILTSKYSVVWHISGNMLSEKVELNS